MGEEMNNNEAKTKKSMLAPIIIVVAVLLIVAGVFLLLNNNGTKTNNEENNGNNGNPQTTTENVEQFEGIYVNGEDKIYIRKTSNREFHYIIGGSFEGYAVVSGDSAKEKSSFNEDEYFEFKIVDGGIELVYNAPENHEIVVETGVYTKVAEYTPENIYKEAVGDPQYLETGHNGVYKNETIELYVFQISESEVLVKASNTSDIMFDEKFEKVVNEINLETQYVAKSFFDKEKDAFLLNFFDNSIEIIVRDDVFGFNEEDRKLEGNYTFERKVTQDEIINNFYGNY